MAPIVSSIEIARPPEEVFSYATDPSRFAEWQHDVVSLRIEGGGAPGVGSPFTTTRRIGGVARTMTQEITENNPPKTWAARAIAGPIRAHADITIEPLNGGTRSRVTFALDFEGHGIGVPLVPSHPPDGSEGGAQELPEPEGTARKRRSANSTLPIFSPPPPEVKHEPTRELEPPVARLQRLSRASWISLRWRSPT
jgi:uncharacterized protein YndB with AHSA1/START domain